MVCVCEPRSLSSSLSTLLCFLTGCPYKYRSLKAKSPIFTVSETDFLNVLLYFFSLNVLLSVVAFQWWVSFCSAVH